jgi:hypothetical protein
MAAGGRRGPAVWSVRGPEVRRVSEVEAPEGPEGRQALRGVREA